MLFITKHTTPERAVKANSLYFALKRVIDKEFPMGLENVGDTFLVLTVWNEVACSLTAGALIETERMELKVRERRDELRSTP